MFMLGWRKNVHKQNMWKSNFKKLGGSFVFKSTDETLGGSLKKLV